MHIKPLLYIANMICHRFIMNEHVIMRILTFRNWPPSSFCLLAAWFSSAGVLFKLLSLFSSLVNLNTESEKKLLKQKERSWKGKYLWYCVSLYLSRKGRCQKCWEVWTIAETAQIQLDFFFQSGRTQSNHLILKVEWLFVAAVKLNKVGSSQTQWCAAYREQVFCVCLQIPQP